MTVSSLLRVLPVDAPGAVEPAVRLINRTAYFSGQCDQCRPHCGAICCTGYGFVSLTEDEARSGRYLYKEASDACKCTTCERMRQMGVKYTLLKQADGSCMYLDGERRCSIYNDRPETCRNYSCRNIPFRLSPP
jgi:Fe-S-cluster containining protein